MKIGFIGCGNMASAMIGGILRRGIFQKEEIIVSNLTEEGRSRSREKAWRCGDCGQFGGGKNASLIVLAVKPQFYEEVLTEVRAFLTPEHVIVELRPEKRWPGWRKNAVSRLQWCGLCPIRRRW